MATTVQSLNNRIRKKIKSHKNTDWYMYRKYKDSEYISLEWVRNELKKSSRCRLCGTEMKLTEWEPDDPKQFSVDRLKNWVAHVKLNCQLTCLGCNRQKEGAVSL